MSDIKKALIGVGNLPEDDKYLDNLTDKVDAYLTLLHKWNQTYNLTAIRDKQEMISRHISDSLAILPWLRGEKILDVGTGAGLPGIPLALAREDLQIYLLDSNGKKTRFLQEVKRIMNIKNVEVIQSRVLDYNPPFSFDTVVSRAFSNIESMTQQTNHLLADNGIWLAMKGITPESELINIENKYHVESYQVSGVDGERCCVIIEK
ncbi:MAG: 16S rRNA (guanine(527)-N(7))-methyltransferase RsmG [Legionellaceae bacterium]|nr:16S rRNA (guanine(527)-N(7))-methyltransferase RsmG [Legionellaceae bacterium]